MNRDELLRLLDLPGKDVPAEAGTLEIATVSESPSTPASPTALALDPWGLRRGADLLAESRRLQQSGLDELAVADFHGMAFEVEPVLHSECRDARRLEFLRQLQQTPDYRALHAVTRLDPVAAGIAATALAEQFAGLPPPPSGKEKPSSAGALQEEMNLLRGVGQALSEATREVEQCREGAAALGLGPGSPGSNDPQVIAALFRRVRSSPTLRRICELAGRYRRLAQSCQRRKVVHGLDEVVGVTLGGDLDRLLAGELARLADDDLGEDLLRRLVERQLMCREHQASEPVGKGPICVVVDESGSMAVRHFTA